jgi:hypothetical protein
LCRWELSPRSKQMYPVPYFGTTRNRLSREKTTFALHSHTYRLAEVR